jgi:hypothetical protein
MTRVAVGFLLLSVTACAPVVPVLVITPDSEAQRDGRLPSEVMNTAAVTPRDGTGAIVVTRKKSLLADRCTYDVALDDQLVAGLRPGEQVTLYADPGTRIVAVSIRDEGSCDSVNAQVALKVIAHARNDIRVGPDPHYDLKVEVDTYGGSLPP